MDSADVILRREGALGRITLNRPKALNALTRDMCAAIFGALREWARDPAIQTVLIDAVPGRAFCAGGDIRAAAEEGRKDPVAARAFFQTEYPLNAAIKNFPKPYVALLDGIVMGGGAGVSVHGTYRVATENTLFAMPETGIGLYPDIGASYFLSRLPGELGMYLALTGARLNAADMIYSGLATHRVAATTLDPIAPRLARGENPEALLAEMSVDTGDAPFAAHRAAIDRVFAAPSVEKILDALAVEGEWGAETAAHLRTCSPTSLKLAYREIRDGARLDFASCMRMEYRLTSRVLQAHDFYEGVRALLIDKDRNPRWQPDRLDSVKDADIARYFAPMGAAELVL